MIYASAKEWLDAPQKRVLLFGMSGLGKTHISNMLRDAGDWYHYSIDYRIGTKYMGEYISDNIKRQAMQVPFLRELLLTDSIRLQSKITFDNLAPLSTYLGKPGNPSLGGLALGEYQRRQAQHEAAEISALLDTPFFIDKSQGIYGYANFVCDTGGSICEVVDPDDPEDLVMSALSDCVLPVWIKGSEAHTEALVARFDKAPKPMCYQPSFLAQAWEDYAQETGRKEQDVDPNAFVRWTYARAMAHRGPRYAAMAKHWGLTIAADDVARVSTAAEFCDIVADAFGRKSADDR